MPMMLMAKTNITVMTMRERLITMFALRISIVVCISLYVLSSITVPSNLIPENVAAKFSLIGTVSLRSRSLVDYEKYSNYFVQKTHVRNRSRAYLDRLIIMLALMANPTIIRGLMPSHFIGL